MNYECKVETKSPIRRELTISVKPESIKTYMDQQFATLQKNAQIKGFRAGKVPMSVLKSYYLKDVKSDVFSKLVRESYVRALEENKLVAVGTPEIEAKSGVDLDDGQELTYVAKIEIFPEIEIKDLSKIKVVRPSSEVKDEDIEKSLQHLRENHADIVQNEDYAGPAKNGDIAVITFEGTLEGKSLEALKGENRTLEIGLKNYMEDFEKNLLGMKKGEEKTFTMKFPEPFADPQLAGKEAEFKVTLHEFKKKEVPALDDEFAKRFKLETALELRKKVVETLTEDRERESREKLKESLFEELRKTHEFEVPTGLVDSQLEYLMRENAEYLKRQGFTEKMVRDYLDKNATELRERATDQVKNSLILDKVAKEQSIKVESKDLDVEYQKMGERLNLPVEQVKQLYGQDEEGLRQLRFRIREERTMDYVLSQVKVTSAK